MVLPTPTRFIAAVVFKTLGNNDELASHIIDRALADLREKILQRREVEVERISEQEERMQSPTLDDG